MNVLRVCPFTRLSVSKPQKESKCKTDPSLFTDPDRRLVSTITATEQTPDTAFAFTTFRPRRLEASHSAKQTRGFHTHGGRCSHLFAFLTLFLARFHRSTQNIHIFQCGNFEFLCSTLLLFRCVFGAFESGELQGIKNPEGPTAHRDALWNDQRSSSALRWLLDVAPFPSHRRLHGC